jgi:hypothetical protein
MQNNKTKNKPNTQGLANMISCLKGNSKEYFETISEQNRIDSQLYSIADYQKNFETFFNQKTLPVKINNNSFVFNLGDEIDYIRSQLAEELDYEHLWDDFFTKSCLLKIWTETLFFKLKNSIKNSSITDKYGTKANDWDWNCVEFIETDRRSKYKESLFSKYNLKTFLFDYYLSNNRIYINLDQKFAERLRFLVGQDSQNWLKDCVQQTAIEACREWIFSIPKEDELSDYQPFSTDECPQQFILDNRLIVNWEHAK